ncbi:MAG: DUF2024 family protein [Bacteroidota bacterium]
MEIAVFDTYVKKPEGGLMHFDILVESGVTGELVYQYGKKYLTEKGYPKLDLTSKECKFCHVEQPGADIRRAIIDKGFAIIEMQGC